MCWLRWCCGASSLRDRGTRLPNRQDGQRALPPGAVGVASTGWLVFWGISLTTATDASLMIVGEVLFTTLFALAISREALGLPRGVGMAIGLLGVVILIAGGSAAPLESAPVRALGDVLILTGLACEAFFTVFGTRHTQRYDPLVAPTVTLSGSCVVWGPVIAWYLLAGNLKVPSQAALGGVAYLRAAEQRRWRDLIWFSVLKTAGATLGALSLLAQPVVGVVPRHLRPGRSRPAEHRPGRRVCAGVSGAGAAYQPRRLSTRFSNSSPRKNRPTSPTGSTTPGSS